MVKLLSALTVLTLLADYLESEAGASLSLPNYQYSTVLPVGLGVDKRKMHDKRSFASFHLRPTGL